MSTSLIMEKITFLRGAINPDIVDGGPGQPGLIYRTALANYVVAEILRDLASSLTDKAVATQLHSIGKELVSDSSKGLVADWDEGDSICPPWSFLHHKPDPNPLVQRREPDPSPWLGQITPAMNDIVLAIAVRELASLTTNENASAAMKQIGETITKSASNRVYDEYCATPVKPRVPALKPKSTAA